MKKTLPLFIGLFCLVIISCSHKYYTSSLFDQQTAHHKVVAVLPAEMVFTGKQPENLTIEDIAKIEDFESKNFQHALYNSILRYANSRKYYTRINLQDLVMTEKLLQEHNISSRDAWKKDDKELATILGVDAVIRMRIQKQRYMSDVASYGISVGRQIINNTGIGSKVPFPYVPNKTNDIYASCDIVSNNQTLWNDNYKGASDWNTPSNVVIENITDNFGRHFPYKQRR
ncbi:MAG TPA: hypothetical protein VGQ09_19620 [Chitinophagaceae bacterium]|jgi:hypothetical protein|nr:hypothetical protein [Chitinophagaceae bacterium]